MIFKNKETSWVNPQGLYFFTLYVLHYAILCHFSLKLSLIHEKERNKKLFY